jgi:hypothetical protein
MCDQDEKKLHIENTEKELIISMRVENKNRSTMKRIVVDEEHILTTITRSRIDRRQ